MAVTALVPFFFFFVLLTLRCLKSEGACTTSPSPRPDDSLDSCMLLRVHMVVFVFRYIIETTQETVFMSTVPF